MPMEIKILSAMAQRMAWIRLARDRRRHPDHVGFRIAQIAEIDRYGFCPTEHNAAHAGQRTADQQRTRNQDRSYRVNMLDRVQR